MNGPAPLINKFHSRFNERMHFVKKQSNILLQGVIPAQTHFSKTKVHDYVGFISKSPSPVSYSNSNSPMNASTSKILNRSYDFQKYQKCNEKNHKNDKFFPSSSFLKQNGMLDVGLGQKAKNYNVFKKQLTNETPDMSLGPRQPANNEFKKQLNGTKSFTNSKNAKLNSQSKYKIQDLKRQEKYKASFYPSQSTEKLPIRKIIHNIDYHGKHQNAGTPVRRQLDKYRDNNLTPIRKSAAKILETGKKQYFQSTQKAGQQNKTFIEDLMQKKPNRSKNLEYSISIPILTEAKDYNEFPIHEDVNGRLQRSYEASRHQVSQSLIKQPGRN